jgi:hypothetical protein
VALINYDGRMFKTITNSDNGEASQETIFRYSQKNNIVRADYSGGGILAGQLIALVDDNGNLDMRYQHINEENEIMTGHCKSRPELMENGKLRMHEEWEWTSKDESKGKSIIEEIQNEI